MRVRLRAGVARRDGLSHCGAGLCVRAPGLLGRGHVLPLSGGGVFRLRRCPSLLLPAEHHAPALAQARYTRYFELVLHGVKPRPGPSVLRRVIINGIPDFSRPIPVDDEVRVPPSPLLPSSLPPSLAQLLAASSSSSSSRTLPSQPSPPTVQDDEEEEEEGAAAEAEAPAEGADVGAVGRIAGAVLDAAGALVRRISERHPQREAAEPPRHPPIFVVMI